MNTKRSAAAVLLPLHAHEVPVVLDALNTFADAEEERGDPLSHAADAERVAARLREFFALQAVSAKETLKAIGLGGYEGRPQG